MGADMMDYKESLEAFKASCRAYRNEKENLVRYKNVQYLNPLTEQLVKFMKEDVDYVDRTLEKIEKQCGTNAKLMIFLLFVEERTQVDIAHGYCDNAILIVNELNIAAVCLNIWSDFVQGMLDAVKQILSFQSSFCILQCF